MMYCVRAEVSKSADSNYCLLLQNIAGALNITDMAMEKAIGCNAEQPALSLGSQVASNLQSKYNKGQ